jgi:geranyl-CoA carboxylase alpha subunit
MVTGEDLVALQFAVAQGLPLPLTQGDVELHGHAMEVRLYAEDTVNDFLPASGPALLWRPPVGEGVRVDHGLLQGQAVSPFYDPMVAKIIAWGEDRNVARRRLLRALENTALFGFETNREFLLAVLTNPCFADGGATTAFIAEQFPEGFAPRPATEGHVLVAACLHHLEALDASEHEMISPSPALSGWSGPRNVSSHFRYELGEDALDVYVNQIDPDRYRVTAADSVHEVAWTSEREVGTSRIAVDGVHMTIAYCFSGRGEITLQLGDHATVLTNLLAFTRGDEAAGGSGSVTAPMHGNVLEVMVAVGDEVSEGDGLAVMEAMKMEHRLVAEVTGRVVAVHASAGTQVAAGSVLLEIEAVA